MSDLRAEYPSLFSCTRATTTIATSAVTFITKLVLARWVLVWSHLGCNRLCSVCCVHLVDMPWHRLRQVHNQSTVAPMQVKNSELHLPQAAVWDAWVGGYNEPNATSTGYCPNDCTAFNCVIVRVLHWFPCSLLLLISKTGRMWEPNVGTLLRLVASYCCMLSKPVCLCSTPNRYRLEMK